MTLLKLCWSHTIFLLNKIVVPPKTTSLHFLLSLKISQGNILSGYHTIHFDYSTSIWFHLEGTKGFREKINDVVVRITSSILVCLIIYRHKYHMSSMMSMWPSFSTLYKPRHLHFPVFWRLPHHLYIRWHINTFKPYLIPTFFPLFHSSHNP